MFEQNTLHVQKLLCLPLKLDLERSENGIDQTFSHTQLDDVIFYFYFFLLPGRAVEGIVNCFKGLTNY